MQDSMPVEIIASTAYQCLGCGSIINSGQIHVCPRAARIRQIKHNSTHNNQNMPKPKTKHKKAQTKKDKITRI